MEQAREYEKRLDTTPQWLDSEVFAAIEATFSQS